MEATKNQAGNAGPGGKNARGSNDNNLKALLNEEMKGNEDLINFLENKLDQHEKNLGLKQQEYEALQ